MTRRWALAAVAALMLGGCGATSSPNQPSAPGASPSTGSLVVRNGVTEQPVTAQVSPQSPRVGDRVTVNAAGYLTREQVLETGDVFLWPGDPAYVHEVAYWEFNDSSFRTLRWTAGFTVTVDDSLAGDAAIMAKAREVAAEAARNIGFPVTVGAGGAVTIGVDPALGDMDAVAQASVDSRGSVINGARIVFIRRDEIAGGAGATYTNTFLHEMGHVIGLGHSPDITEVMTPAEGPGTFAQVYQPKEASCLHMIYAHRRAGNFYPDRDPAFTASAASSPRHTVIID